MQILPDRVSEWKCSLVHSDKPDDTSLCHDAIIAPYDEKSNLVRQTDTNYASSPHDIGAVYVGKQDAARGVYCN